MRKERRHYNVEEKVAIPGRAHAREAACGMSGGNGMIERCDMRKSRFSEEQIVAVLKGS